MRISLGYFIAMLAAGAAAAAPRLLLRRYDRAAE